ncbi:MAG: hypothetical protein GY906_00925 [bacterium]|nr:hypothetical protein [bacterium]
MRQVQGCWLFASIDVRIVTIEMPYSMTIAMTMAMPVAIAVYARSFEAISFWSMKVPHIPIASPIPIAIEISCVGVEARVRL